MKNCLVLEVVKKFSSVPILRISLISTFHCAVQSTSSCGLGHSTVWCYLWTSMFWRNMLLKSPGHKQGWRYHDSPKCWCPLIRWYGGKTQNTIHNLNTHVHKYTTSYITWYYFITVCTLKLSGAWNGPYAPVEYHCLEFPYCVVVKHEDKLNFTFITS